MDTAGFGAGLRHIADRDALRTAVLIEVPATDAERLAEEWGRREAGSDDLFELPAGMSEREARRHASAISKVDLKRFGIFDRHVRAEVGVWHIPGEPLDRRHRLRVKVVKGGRRNRRNRSITATSSGLGSGAPDGVDGGEGDAVSHRDDIGSGAEN